MVNRGVFAIIGLLLYAQAAAGQQPVPGIAERAAEDTARRKTLTERGTRIEGEHVVLWFPAALNRADAQALVSRLDPAVAELRRYIGTHDWQANGSAKLTYYVSDEKRFLSHATGADIFMSLESIRAGRAPYLSQAVFVLTRPKNAIKPTDSDAVWLTRGLSDYIIKTAVPAGGFDENRDDLYTSGTPAGAHQRCAERAASPEGVSMLSYIGVSRRPMELIGDQRERFGPPFFACALSFTTYLVEQIGLHAVVSLIPLIPDRTVDPGIERATKRSMETVRAEWRRKIGITTP